MRLIDHEGLVSRPVAEVIKRAGGYYEVRMGNNQESMVEIVRYCVDQEPDWFLVRGTARIPLTIGEFVSEEVAREPIQKALLRELKGSIVLTKTFNMRDAASDDKYLLLHRRLKE